LSKKIAYIVITLCWATVFGYTWHEANDTQWDLKTYYSAAYVYSRGQDPYDVQILRAITGGRFMLPYYYPLTPLYLAKPIAGLSYTSVHRLWLILKLLALVTLLLIWQQAFLDRANWLLTLVIALFGFHAAAIWDIKSGNVAMIEQALLWAGFACLLRSRVTAFVVFVVLASVFKVTPVVFLGLLLLPPFRTRSNTVKLAGGVIAIAALVLVPFAWHPEYFDGFRHGLTGAHPRLEQSPTFVAAVDELMLHYRLFDAAWLKYAAIVTYYAVVLAVSWRLIRRGYACESPRSSILLAAMIYALLMPRFVIYSYIIVIAPVLGLVIPAVRKLKLEAAAVVVALGISGLVFLPFGVGEFLGSAVPLLLLLSCWLVLVAFERTGRFGEFAGSK
jgi:hypothetical protein